MRICAFRKVSGSIDPSQPSPEKEENPQRTSPITSAECQCSVNGIIVAPLAEPLASNTLCILALTSIIFQNLMPEFDHPKYGIKW